MSRKERVGKEALKRVLWGFVAGGLLVVLCVLPVFAVSYDAATTWNLTNTSDKWEANPTWSLDCSKVVYAREDSVSPSHTCNVYVINNANTANPSEPILISKGQDTHDKIHVSAWAAFNRAGDKVLFTVMAAAPGAPALAGDGIWIANADGSGSPIQLLDNVEDDGWYENPQIAWSDPNDVEWVVYTNRGQLGVGKLVGNSVTDVKDVTAFTDVDATYVCSLPRWSADGEKIVFMRVICATEDEADIFVLSNPQDIISGLASPPTVWTNNIVQITTTTDKMSITPCFSLDGSKIFYSEDVSGNFHSDDFDTSLATAFDRNNVNDDGVKVEFDLYITDADGTGSPTKYDNQYYNQAYLNMSPDGMWITYLDDSTGNGEIYISAVKSTETLSAGGSFTNIDNSAIKAGDADGDYSIYKPKTIPGSSPFVARDLNGLDNLTTPAEITIHYTDKELGSYSEDNLYIVKWNSSTSKWERVSGTITRDKTNNTITIPVSTFSIYGVESSAAAAAAKKDDDGICAIATASYGTPMAEEVKVLSTFRDEYLLTNKTGQELVKFYYCHSPAVADFIRGKESLKAVVRTGLKPLVWVAEKITH